MARSALNRRASAAQRSPQAATKPRSRPDSAARAPAPGRTPRKKDLEALSDFRYQLRRFLRFSDEAVRAEGITPLQYLLLLHIKGFPGRDWAIVGELAERLQSQHHGTVALVSRCERLGLVRRRPNPEDRRRVQVHLTAEGERRIERLARIHRTELLQRKFRF
jgi:DNA-binding MarR family transcriptional regulator